jgi:2',3'-cyclic-nucleotide 2'-phosphodiesterase (5'-nucleotidase family)
MYTNQPNHQTQRVAIPCLLFRLIPCIFLLCAVATHATAEDISMTILFTSDHHDQVLPLGKPLDHKIVGGVTRRHTLIRKIREEAGKDRVILVDAGDLFYGTEHSGARQAEIGCAAYQLMGYDAVTIGNHDFDYGRDTLQKCLFTYQTPWISATLIDLETRQHYLKPYRIKSISGIRVGIIGLTSPDAFKKKERKKALGLTISSPVTAAQELRARLRQDADVYIALTHQGLEADLAFARQFPYMHVIIGGHDHRVLFQALVEKNNDGRHTKPIIAHAGHRGSYLGRLDITVSGNRQAGYRVTRYEYRLIPVTGDIPESTEMASLLARMMDMQQKTPGGVE